MLMLLLPKPNDGGLLAGAVAAAAPPKLNADDGAEVAAGCCPN